MKLRSLPGAFRYAVLAAVLALPLAAWRHTYFVADDWMILARYLGVEWSEIPGWFVSVRHDWYRPVYELWMAAGWRLFGLHPEGFHLAALAIYVAVCALVGILAEALTQDRRVAYLATALFTVFHFHAEPVLWIAAGSDLLAALFALVSLGAFVAYRRRGLRRFYALALLAFVAALGSKESVALFGLATVGYDLLLGSRPWRSRALSWAPFLAIGALGVAWRMAEGNPYPVAITPALLVKNAGHYAVMLLLAAPIDFDILSLVRRDPGAPLLPSATTIASAGSLFVICGAWIWKGGWRHAGGTGATKVLAYAVLFAGVTLAPVLPIVAERTAFLPSVGIAWGMAIVAVGALDGAGGRRLTARAPAGGILAAVLVFGAANVAALVHRAEQWQSAGAMSRVVMDQLVREMPTVQESGEVWLVYVPDHSGFAWAFRNAFHPERAAASEVLGLNREVRAVLEPEAAALLSSAAQAGRPVPPDVPDSAALRSALGVDRNTVVFWFDGEGLVRVPAAP